LYFNIQVNYNNSCGFEHLFCIRNSGTPGRLGQRSLSTMMAPFQNSNGIATDSTTISEKFFGQKLKKIPAWKFHA